MNWPKNKAKCCEAKLPGRVTQDLWDQDGSVTSPGAGHEAAEFTCFYFLLWIFVFDWSDHPSWCSALLIATLSEYLVCVTAY